MSHDFINVKKLTARINEVKEELAHLMHLESLLGIKTKGKRGRKLGSTNKARAPKVKPSKKRKGKRGEVGAKIAAYVTSKGAVGAHVQDIADATRIKKANVTAFFYSPGGKAKFKNIGKATFAVKK